jgi:hypothetical protein
VQANGTRSVASGNGSFTPICPCRQPATAILDRFLHHAEVLTFSGKSYRLRAQPSPGGLSETASNAAIAPTGSEVSNHLPNRPSSRKNRKPASETACQT